MRVTVLSSDSGDWKALYVDGFKKTEGHSLGVHNVLEALGIECEEREVPTDPEAFPNYLPESDAYRAALREAASRLYAKIGPQKNKWCVSIGVGVIAICVNVMSERDMKKVPAEWEGFPVNVLATGSMRMCSK